MAYAYDSLERALELALYRAPVSQIGSLISRTEYVISNAQDSTALENELLEIAGVGTIRKLFCPSRLKKEDTFDAAKVAA